MKYNPNKYNRQSIRLKGYDYTQVGLYFITICIQNRASIFGNIQNGILHLNEYGQIAFTEWQKTAEIRKNCIIHEFIIMPNHIHGIIEIKEKFHKSKSNSGTDGSDRGKGELGSSKGKLQFAPTTKSVPTTIGKLQSPSQTIGSIIRGYKIATIKKIKDLILEKNSNIDKSKLGTGELQFAPTNSAPTEIIKSLNFKIWQRNYYEHIIRNKKAYNNIANYIINNPKKWNKDKFYK